MTEQPPRVRDLDPAENTPPSLGETVHIKTLTDSKFHAYYPN
jgi:hypothetical protein